MRLAAPRSLIRKIPLLVVMVTIFALSHQPGDSLPLPALPGLDKFAHAGVYGVLAAAALFALAPSSRQSKPVAVAIGVAAFCLLFGLSDEYHQSFIDGRFASGWDLFADGLGAIMVAGLWWWRGDPVLSRAASR